MRRLTVRDENGVVALVCREGCKGGPACFECEQIAVDRLAAYEDIGRTPEEMDELLNKSYGPLHKKLGEWMKADADGRLVVLPDVPEDDRQAFVDGLHDYFQDASNYDPGVGIFGMRDGEAKLAAALMDALRGPEAETIDSLMDGLRRLEG